MTINPNRRDALKAGAAGVIGAAVSSQIIGAEMQKSPSAADAFANPTDDCRPWVYWIFMDGHLSEAGMTADLEAMKRAGIGGAICMEVDLGLARGPIKFMSKQWQSLIVNAFAHADDIGIEISMATGPGWCGTGGPWVKPEHSMQLLVSSETQVSQGPGQIIKLAQPKPRAPFFGIETLTPALKKQWEDYYVDSHVIAFPKPRGAARIEDIDEKALYTRGAYTSAVLGPYTKRPWVRPFLPSAAQYLVVPEGHAVPLSGVIDLTDKLGGDGTLTWDVPQGEWTIMRFGRTLTAQTTRPAPEAGLGFETDKFSRHALDRHLEAFVSKILKELPRRKRKGRGLTTLHFDSWEMGSQNASALFQREFATRRGYDPTRYLPTFSGYVVGSHELSERFLWDVRQTAQELVFENHILRLREQARRSGLQLSMQFYDLNPTSDMQLGSAADVPMGEFWSKDIGFSSEFSIIEATSIAHTNGKRIVGAEAFTAENFELWRQHPASMKDQGDWALCAGVNRFVFHRFQAQPANGGSPGMTFGPKGGYGVHWDRTQTWWDMVPAYHKYISRCQQVLRSGLFVADVLYLIPERAPNVFVPPNSAFLPGKLADRRGYNFDGCAPEALINRATVKDGRIIFPDGMSYYLLVLPRSETMTPRLLRKIAQLVSDGATVIGQPPSKSPSLSDHPRCDEQVQDIAKGLWENSSAGRPGKFGKGQVWLDTYRHEPSHDNPLENAAWIWSSAADRKPKGQQRCNFSYEFKVADASQIIEAEVLIGGCASFDVSINGEWIGSGQNHQLIERFDFTSLLKNGTNKIDVKVVWQDTPASALPDPWGRTPERLAPGLIAAIVLTSDDQTRQIIPSSKSWFASSSGTSTSAAAEELGSFGAPPWTLTDTAIKQSTLYPSYRTTARILSSQGVSPDFDAGEDIRFIHRHDGPVDMYFVGNRRPKQMAVTCKFRVRGRQPYWWDPQTGEKRPLPEFSIKDTHTVIPLTLAPLESGFVVFDETTAVVKRSGKNHTSPEPLITLPGPWSVSFDPQRGGPPKVIFDTLSDWIENDDPGIRHYSGKAVYTTQFDWVATDQALHHYLALGQVRNMASITLNGRDLGTLWCDPWEVRIPARVLKAGTNTLQVTVANLWINRLVGDSGLPVEKRVTWTPDSDPMPKDTPLQSSGLLGPVRLLTRPDTLT